MSNVIISTEATSDLTREIIDKYGIVQVGMDYVVDDEEYNTVTKNLEVHELYKKIRNGSKVSTSQINTQIAYEHLSDLVKVENVLHLSFSSAMSGTCASFQSACKKVNEENKTNKCYVCDSLCASTGQGLFVVLVCEKAKEDISFEELCEYAENLKLHICHIFTVDNLKYLQRSGRISKTSACLGNLLSIKPLLHVNDNGQIVPMQKVFGRKMALTKMVEVMKQTFTGECKEVWVNNADCIDDAKYVCSLVEQEFGIKPKIFDLGVIISGHSGPGTIALFYVGSKR